MRAGAAAPAAARAFGSVGRQGMDPELSAELSRVHCALGLACRARLSGSSGALLVGVAGRGRAQPAGCW